MKKSNISIIKHIPDFLDYCAVEKGLSDNTQKNYSFYLNKFKTWLEKNSKTDLKPYQLNPEHIWKYRLFLSRSDLEKTTQNYYLIALRALLSYFSARNISSLPVDKIELPKGKKGKTLKFLTLGQIEKLFSAPDVQTVKGLRDKAILETLFSTGLRVAELTSLNKEQFENIEDKNDYELSIVGKGGYLRTVYFSERALCWLKKYLKKRKDEKKALFIGYKGKKNQEPRLTTRSVERIVKKYAVKAGIPIFTTPHTLRHSLATDFLNQGVDLRTIQEFLGHRSITSTQIYTHVTSKRLREIHRKFHGGRKI